MAVGRISGPLLKANLLRNGVDLAFENDLLYLDVNNLRVGVKTNNPSHDLTVNGTTRTTNLEVTDTANIGAITITSNSITSNSDNLNLAVTGSSAVVYQKKLKVDKLTLNNNVISSNVINTDIELQPNGLGQVKVYGDTTIYGNLHATGNITADGDIQIGDQNTDSVVFNAEVSSDFIPNADAFYSLGTTDKRWKEIWARNLYATDLTVGHLEVDNVVLGLRPGKTYYVSTNGSDSKTGTHQNDPFRTIKHALSVATAGETVMIYAGVYEEIFPLTIPDGVSVKGFGIRSVTVKPTSGTITNDAFLLNGEVTIEDLTITGFRYNAGANTGHAFRFASGYTVTTRSPYIRNVTVITAGTPTSLSDPRGFAASNAGRGAFLDGSVASSSSKEAACLFHSVTFICPGVDAVVATNGVRIEWLNSFTYFANRSMYLYRSSQGFANIGMTRLKIPTQTGVWQAGDTISLYDVDGITVLASGTIANITGEFVNISGLSLGFASVEAPATQDIRTTLGGTSNRITFVDYSDFGVEVRAIASAAVYGNYGIYGDGDGVIAYLIGQNLAYIGNGKEVSNDPTTVLQANEIVELNRAKIYYQSVDHKGDFRVGDLFYINQQTGEITFSGASTTIGSNLTFNDGSGHTTYIDGTKIETGDFRITNNTISTLTQDFNISSATDIINLQNNVNITGDLGVTGNVTIGGNITIGDQTSDSINFIAGITSDLVPETTNTYDLGTSALRWKNAYLQSGYIGGLLISSNQIQPTTTGASLTLTGNGTGSVNIEDISVQNNTISTGSNTDLILQPNGSGIVSIDSTQSLKLPSGTDLQRPGTASAGMIRWNTTSNRYEGYDGVNWIALNGVQDLDGNTKITAELTPGANDNTIRFYVNGSVISTVTSDAFTVQKLNVDNTTINNNTISTTGGNNLTLSADGTGAVILQKFQFKNNTITNTVTDAVTTFAQTGTGYVKFAGTGGVVIPSGTNFQRPGAAETGMVRYNTESLRVEVYSGTDWVGLQGPLGGITRYEAEEIAIKYALTLG